MIKEIWKDIPGYEGYYQVSDLGRVRSLDRFRNRGRGVIAKVKGRILKPVNATGGYFNVSLTKNGFAWPFRIHVLVAMAFLEHTPNGNTLVVNHINFNKTDNKLDNLEVITARENANMKHIPSSSEYVGVHLHKPSDMWYARIVYKKVTEHLGSFKNEIDAHIAYQKALHEINNGIYTHKQKRIPLSKQKGVSRDKDKWQARITINGKRKFFGAFNCETAAITAVQKGLRDANILTS